MPSKPSKADTDAAKINFSNNCNLKKEKLILFKSAVVSAVNALKPNPSSKKRARKKQELDDLDTIASRITANYNTILARFQGPGTEWEAWHCFVGTELVYAVRPRAWVMAEITGGPVLQNRKLSLFAFRSALSSVQDTLKQQSKPETNVLHAVDPDPDHMDRTEIIKVRTDMDDIMYNAFADACRIAMAKKHAQSRVAQTAATKECSSSSSSVSSTSTSSSSSSSSSSSASASITTNIDLSFADAAMYIRSRLEMMEVFGGEWHVVAAKANKGELQGGRACSANIDADAKKATIVTGGGVRIFAFQHADNAPSDETCSNKCMELMTSKKRSATIFFMFAFMFLYFMLGKMEALQCLKGDDGTNNIPFVACTAEKIEWAETIEAGRTGVLVAALGFFVVGSVLKTMKASQSRNQTRFLKRQ